MDDPKEGGLLTPNRCDWTTYQFCKIALRCVFIFAPIYYHINVHFSIKIWQPAYYCKLPHYHFPLSALTYMVLAPCSNHYQGKYYPIFLIMQEFICLSNPLPYTVILAYSHMEHNWELLQIPFFYIRHKTQLITLPFQESFFYIPIP